MKALVKANESFGESQRKLWHNSAEALIVESYQFSEGKGKKRGGK